MKDTIKEFFKKILEEKRNKLSTKAIERASNISKPRAGTPHDWEDYENYLEELRKKNK